MWLSRTCEPYSTHVLSLTYKQTMDASYSSPGYSYIVWTYSQTLTCTTHPSATLCPIWTYKQITDVYCPSPGYPCFDLWPTNRLWMHDTHPQATHILYGPTARHWYVLLIPRPLVPYLDLQTDYWCTHPHATMSYLWPTGYGCVVLIPRLLMYLPQLTDRLVPCTSTHPSATCALSGPTCNEMWYIERNVQ